MRAVLAGLLLTFFFMPFAGICDDPPPPTPIQEGVTCSDENAIFYSTASTRSPWSIAEIIPAPVGTISPDQWDEYVMVKGLVAQLLPASPTAVDYAQAAVSVGKDFFSGEADVLVNLGRTISKMDTKLQCTSGFWVYVSQSTSTVNDTSDWLLVADHLDVNGTQSVADLSASLTTLLSTLNSQPGAQN